MHEQVASKATKTGGRRFDRFGVVVVLFVSPNDVDLQLFSLGASNDCKSSLLLMSELTLLLVI